jgi:hypothetical protein
MFKVPMVRTVWDDDSAMVFYGSPDWPSWSIMVIGNFYKD